RAKARRTGTVQPDIQSPRARLQAGSHRRNPVIPPPPESIRCSPQVPELVVCLIAADQTVVRPLPSHKKDTARDNSGSHPKQVSGEQPPIANVEHPCAFSIIDSVKGATPATCHATDALFIRLNAQGCSKLAIGGCASLIFGSGSAKYIIALTRRGMRPLR